MNIPKYVIDLMIRAHYYYSFDVKDERCGAGYTIAIKKGTPYQRAETLCAECERLKKWADRQAGGTCCYIIRTPKHTTHGDQLAIITIFDPVMKQIEKYIHP